MKHATLLAYSSAMVLCVGAAALAPNEIFYDLSWNTLDGGGGVSTGAEFEFAGTIGQPDCGPVMTGGDFEFTGGFWGAPRPESIDCPADLTGDDVVDVFDLLELLSSWGWCPSCPADITGDDVVDVFDLLEVLAHWGPCD
jgi:hypothetical protein